MRRAATGLLAMILAALIGWRILGPGDDDRADAASTDSALGAYARDVTLTTTDTEGRVDWRVRSSNVRHDRHDDTWRLTGDVVMEYQRPSGMTRLTTTLLELDVPARYAETDRAVTLTQPDARIDAVGARAWLDERRIELLENVRGHYDAASS